MPRTITEMRQELADMQNELTQATEQGYAMARDRSTEIAAIQAQSELIDGLQARIALMRQDVEAQEREGRSAVENATRGHRNGGSAFANMGDFMAAVRNADTPGRERDARLTSVRDSATGQNEATPADGGYLVPPEYADGILEFVGDASVLYPQARRVQIDGNRLIEIYLNEYNRADSVVGTPSTRHGGVLAYWKAEAAQYEAAKAAFGERTTNLLKLTAYCPVTEELLQDYSAIEGVLNNLVGREFGFKIDDAILNGSGNGMPLGVLASSATPSQNNAALVTVAKESGQAAATVNYQNIIKMYNALIAQNRPNTRWYINQDLEIALMQLLMPTGSINGSATGDSPVEDFALTGTFGAPIYMPPGAYGNASAMLLGRPVQPIEQCAAMGTKGDIVLADMSQYLIIERAGVTKQSSMHIRFDYDETVFKFTWRVGGRPDWMNVVAPYKGSTSRSPYVCLAARA